MNRKDLIEELHRIKESIASLNDALYSIEDELIDSCCNNSGNMKNTFVLAMIIYMLLILS